MDTKLCKDCKFCHTPSSGEQFNECRKPQGVNLSTGGVKIHRWKYCEILRDANFIASLVFNQCGTGARWFEPKEPA